MENPNQSEDNSGNAQTIGNTPTQPTARPVVASTFSKAEPDLNLRIEYLRIWAMQSALFWSRLQTVAALHTIVLAGWFKLYKDNEPLAPWLLLLGVLLGVIVLLIMHRDSEFMDELRVTAGDVFPKLDRPRFGRKLGCLIAILLVAIELVLLTISAHSNIPQ